MTMCHRPFVFWQLFHVCKSFVSLITEKMDYIFLDFVKSLYNDIILSLKYQKPHLLSVTSPESFKTTEVILVTKFTIIYRNF